MGMFDYVNLRIKCPKCATFIRDFQSKDGSCLMNTLEIEEVDNFYSSCPNCDAWIEFQRKEPSERTITMDELKRSFKVTLN